MSLLIDDPETVAAIEALAASKKLSTEDAVRDAVERERERLEHEASFARRMKALADRAAAFPPTGDKADKAFFDDQGL